MIIDIYYNYYCYCCYINYLITYLTGRLKLNFKRKSTQKYQHQPNYCWYDDNVVKYNH